MEQTSDTSAPRARFSHLQGAPSKLLWDSVYFGAVAFALVSSVPGALGGMPDSLFGLLQWGVIAALVVFGALLIPRIWHDLGRRRRGEPHPPVVQRAVELGPEGIVHSTNGSTRQIAWSEITSVAYHNGFYDLQLTGPDGPRAASLAAWALDADERTQADRLLRHYLPAQVFEASGATPDIEPGA